MSKPYGISLGINSAGLPTMHVKAGDRAADAVWDAVELAMSCGWEPRQFRAEAEEAWEYNLKQQADDVRRAFRS